MRLVSSISKVLMWILLVLYTIIQAGAVFSIATKNNAGAIEAGKPEQVYNVIPLILITVAMIAAVLLYVLWKKRPYVGVLLGFAAAICMLIVALDLGRFFPVRISGYDTDQGLTMVKLIWRHIGFALVPIFMLMAWLFEKAADKREPFMHSMEGKEGYDLSGVTLFSNVEEDGYSLMEEDSRHRLKRSLKKKMEKQRKF